MRTTDSRLEREPMRHIPEDELHAYLDQGLSRTQCVEIESHLADCPSCQSLRDGIAALRDRTTALLARLAPPPGVPPAFEVLRKRAAEVASLRRRRLHLLAWAASVVLAVGLGWGASSFVRAGQPGRVPSRVATAPATPARTAAARPSPESSESPRGTSSPAPPESAAAAPPSRAARVRTVASSPSDSGRAARRAAGIPVLNPPPAVELTQLDSPGARGDIELDGMWRTMSWDGAKAAAGERLPHIDGLPVMRVQVQSNEQGARPVMVVAQRLASGQVIRTIEGPATDVTQLLSRGPMSDVDSLFLPGGAKRAADPTGHAMAMQVGDRMLAITGDLPSDSLRAMIRRLNAEMRSK
jgi:anti-sigma factor RsiW